jgi:hypothetical protein
VLHARIGILVIVVAAGLRLHAAWTAPPLSGFDGPYHGAYIGAIFWDGRFQPPIGFTNHPPLYYAVSAAIWRALPDATSPHGVLFALRLVNVACGLAAAAAVAASTRRLLPGRPDAALAALALALFLPMHVAPSARLGNQMMEVALGAGAIAALLACLARPSPRRAALAGVIAGLGVLAKLSVGIIVAAGGIVLLVRGVGLHGARIRATALAAAFGVAAATCASPYFVHAWATRARVADPDVDLWARMDRGHQLPTRPWADYVDLDPAQLVDPGRLLGRGERAVWPVTFASTWFDLFGISMDVYHPRARRGAHALFAIGALLTAACAFGVWPLLRTARSPEGVPLGPALLALVALLNLASYVAFTRAVPTYGALKGTYLSPALTSFVVATAAGLDQLARRDARLRATAAGLVGALALATTVVFWHGGLAPMRVNPADLVLRHYSDPPTLRIFRYFIGRDPGRGRPPPLPR